MNVLSLDNLRDDRKDLQAMLGQEQQKLIDAQNACLRFEGALTYNGQCIAYMEQKVEPSPPQD